MKQINKIYSINAAINEVWEALTNAELINQWHAGPAEFDLREGGTFSLWGGDIHGTNTKVVPNDLLEQDWYSGQPESCYKVSFKLSEKDGNTTVELLHKNVPEEEFEDFSDGWQEYYFDPIKQLLENRI